MKKNDYEDNGMSFTNMNVEGMPFYEKQENRERYSGIKKVKVNKKERRAMVRAAYMTMLPKILITLACFAVVALLLWLWL